MLKEDEKGLEFSNRITCRREECDDREVERWLSGEDHARLVDRVALMNRALDPRQFTGIKEEELARLRARVGSGRRRAWWWIPAAASVLVGVTVLLALPGGGDDDSPVAASVEIVPGEYRAELVLDDGAVIPLSRASREIPASEFSRARNDSAGGLTYREAGGQATPAAIRYNTLKVPAGGFYPVELSDGTRVWLNAASELRYPVVFGDSERVVELSGEGYFEVHEDASHPFTVRLESARVTVLGTSFNVNAYAGEGQVHATLVTGSVSLFSEATGRQVILKPGTRGTLERASGALSVQAVETGVYTAWREGIFYFKEMTLEEITRVLSRWYQVEIRYSNPRLKLERYNGKMPMYSGIEDVLRKIELSGSARFRIEGKTLVVFER
jgi:ferric-dicitrate binding protein FerR (iron transport regulator)